LNPTRQELDALFRMKYGDPAATGWGPRQRLRFGYFTPDDVYEAIVAKLVAPGCSWIDIGCGRDLFPGNPRLAKELSARCKVLFGVDESENILENECLHERARSPIQSFRTDRTFDLATLRMVAEHITDPTAALQSIARLVRPGGKVVIYTINRWSPLSIVSWIVPFRLHHTLKRFVWQTEEKDTFPVAYKMNTRRELKGLLSQAGFQESFFAYLDDCRTTCRFRVPNLVELIVRTALHPVGLHYPENCLLGVYEKLPSH
jgi:2-polyprenyl-3-methyl-5-hydroxy-6-metoxy-1,4-benzoquinol methylase